MYYPVEARKDDIIRSVNQNPVTIISAETGAGKSTQIPQYLCNAGYKVSVTVPSRTAATSLAKRVSEELNSEIGNIVGYQTAYEHSYSNNTRILYTTEGLQLIKELYNTSDSEGRVLIIDEAQKYGINIETLLAWVHKVLLDGSNLKIVVMSAQVSLDSLSKYLFNAPIIRVDGKMYDIEVKERTSSSFVSSIIELATEGRNVLAFVPGKREIEKTIAELNSKNVNASIFPLHADLTITEQQLVFNASFNTKIVVATNVAQSSITIPDIDAVVDTGLERSINLVGGIETLTVGNISYSDYIQRKGRAGRTKPGVYIWCNDMRLRELKPESTPDIYSNRIDQILLRLAAIGVDIRDIDFFHNPPIQRIETSINTLKLLGALDQDSKITEIGKIMVLLPVSVQYSRMIVEAEKRGVLADVATIAAIQECGGIKSYKARYNAFLSKYNCDLIADLECFTQVKDRNAHNQSDAFVGVSERNYYRVLELRSRLFDILIKIYGDVSSTGNPNEILKSCVSGFVEHLYVKSENHWYRSCHDQQRRKLNLYSAALQSNLIMGLPKNLDSILPDGSTQTIYIISSAIMVTEQILKEVAPHLFREVSQSKFNYISNSYIKHISTYFNGELLSSKVEKVEKSKECRELLINSLTSDTIDAYELNPNYYSSELLKLFKHNNNILGSSDEDIREWYSSVLDTYYGNTLPNLTKSKSLKRFYAKLQPTSYSVFKV